MTPYEIIYLASQWCLVIAGVIYTIFAIKQWRAIKKGTEVAKESADAANKSAKVAELALKTDRPYLLIEKAELEGAVGDEREAITSMADSLLQGFKKHDEFHPRATFHFRNYGKGPALLEEIRIRLKPLDKLPPTRNFDDCKNVVLAVEAIGAGDPWNLKTSYEDARSVSVIDHEAIINGQKEIVAYGKVAYRDVFGDKYEVGFCWLLPKPTILKGVPLAMGEVSIGLRVMNVYSRGPKTHNYNEEKKPN